MSDKSHEAIVEGQFGPAARSYLESAVHAGGQDLELMARLVGERPDAAAIDVGCGGGHVAFRLAGLVGRVVAYDLSAEMLAVVAEEARRRGLGNLTTEQGTAESLSPPPASFDVAATRYSAHHWRDLGAGLARMRRAVKRDGLAVFMDAASPGSPLLDTWLQAFELLRDPSHVRDYSPAEWRTALIAAGFRPTQEAAFRVRLDFASWIKRMNTPPAHAEAIRSLQRRAGPEVRRHFAIGDDGSFSIDSLLIAAEAA
jgi:ubiquinone/menaquinone biosynthesis C-methylase UbiE